jgi:hypothetical protein
MNLDTPCVTDKEVHQTLTGWLYLTLLRKFQHECFAAVLSTQIEFFDIDLSLWVGCFFINRNEFMPWMNTIITLLSFPPELELFSGNFPM